MTTARSSTGGRLSSLPADLVGVVLVVGLANLAVFYPAIIGSPLRVVTGLLFVLFVPGYAFVSALFPKDGTAPGETRAGTGDDSKPSARTWGRGLVDHPRGVDRWERLALAFGISLAVVPLLALAVTLSPLTFTTVTVFLTISAFAVLCAAVATMRRLSLHPQQRFRVSPIGLLDRKRHAFRSADSRGEIILSIGLSLAVVFAVGTLGFAVLAPPDGEAYTDFHVLSEGEDGELVAADYPDTFTTGEPEQIHTGIENYEGQSVEYEVVIQIQQVEESEQGVVVTERLEIDRFSTTLAHNESLVTARSLTAPEGWTGTDLRLKFLLYKESPPETPSSETADLDLHLWIDVAEPDQNATASA